MLRSFSLIETLASIILLAILVSNFSNLSIQSTNFVDHNTLTRLQNKINSDIFSNFSLTNIDIDFDIQKDAELKFIDGDSYTKYTYEDNLKLVYIDIPKKSSDLASKTFE